MAFAAAGNVPHRGNGEQNGVPLQDVEREFGVNGMLPRTVGQRVHLCGIGIDALQQRCAARSILCALHGRRYP